MALQLSKFVAAQIAFHYIICFLYSIFNKYLSTCYVSGMKGGRGCNFKGGQHDTRLCRSSNGCQTAEGFISHQEESSFYTKWNGKPLEDLEQRLGLLSHQQNHSGVVQRKGFKEKSTKARIMAKKPWQSSKWHVSASPLVCKLLEGRNHALLLLISYSGYESKLIKHPRRIEGHLSVIRDRQDPIILWEKKKTLE